MCGQTSSPPWKPDPVLAHHTDEFVARVDRHEEADEVRVRRASQQHRLDVGLDVGQSRTRRDDVVPHAQVELGFGRTRRARVARDESPRLFGIGIALLEHKDQIDRNREVVPLRLGEGEVRCEPVPLGYGAHP